MMMDGDDGMAVEKFEKKGNGNNLESVERFNDDAREIFQPTGGGGGKFEEKRSVRQSCAFMFHTLLPTKVVCVSCRSPLYVEMLRNVENSSKFSTEVYLHAVPHPQRTSGHQQR